MQDNQTNYYPPLKLKKQTVAKYYPPLPNEKSDASVGRKHDSIGPNLCTTATDFSPSCHPFEIPPINFFTGVSSPGFKPTSNSFQNLESVVWNLPQTDPPINHQPNSMYPLHHYYARPTFESSLSGLHRRTLFDDIAPNLETTSTNQRRRNNDNHHERAPAESRLTFHHHQQKQQQRHGDDRESQTTDPRIAIPARSL